MDSRNCSQSQTSTLETVFVELSKLMDSRNGPQALRERSGAGDGVARGGAPHKTTILVSKLLEASRNGTQALRGAERRWVRCGAGRGATQKQKHHSRKISMLFHIH